MPGGGPQTETIAITQGHLPHNAESRPQRLPADYLRHLTLRHERHKGHRSVSLGSFWLVRHDGRGVILAACLEFTAERHLPVQLPRTARVVGEGLPQVGESASACHSKRTLTACPPMMSSQSNTP